MKSDSTKKAVKLVPAADKTIRIVEYMIKNASKQCGISEIASALSYSKGTVHSILQTLILREWMAQDEFTGKYYITSYLARLGASAEKANRLVSDFTLVANQMERACGELINLHVLKGITDANLIAKVPSTAHSVRVDFPIGAMIPVVASSAGKCLIAQLDEESVRRTFRLCNNRYTKSTVQSEDEFVAMIQKVAEDGYAVNNAEYEDDVYSVAAPIFSPQGTIVAAINIVVPVTRFSEEKKESLIALVRDGADRILELRGGRAKA